MAMVGRYLTNITTLVGLTGVSECTGLLRPKDTEYWQLTPISGMHHCVDLGCAIVPVRPRAVILRPEIVYVLSSTITFESVGFYFGDSSIPRP